MPATEFCAPIGTRMRRYPRSAKPLAGFVTVTGHFIYRAAGLPKWTVCGQIVEDAVHGGQAHPITCKRCLANLRKWQERAPNLITT